MKVAHIKKQEIKPSVWSGGTTYEYCIYPADSTYLERNFDFRISNACINAVPSVFTQFNGYQRYLVMLDNDLICVRNDVAEQYRQHEVFSFSSSDVIVSTSMGTDFNLMLKLGSVANVSVVELLDSILNVHFITLFSLEGGVITICDQIYTIEKNDCILIVNKDKEAVQLQCEHSVILAYWN